MAETAHMNRRRQHAFDTVAGQEEKMRTSTNRVVVGLDNGGKVNNATVLETSGRFLVDGLSNPPAAFGSSRYCD